MLSQTKKGRKKAQLKQHIISSESITRAEAVEHLDMDIRTAASYLENLCKQGFCRKESIQPDGKGRPGIIYRLNTENMVFAGVAIRQNMSVECVLCNFNGEILISKDWELGSMHSKLSLFNSISDVIKDIAGSFPDKVLGGIGIAVSRWLQPPLAAYDLYNGLAKFLEKQSGLEVHRNININALAYDVANKSGLRDIILIHPGNVIELGVIQKCRSIQNYQEHENTFAHLMVNQNGLRCYCGKKGCLENYVTNGALQEKLSALVPEAKRTDLSSGNPKFRKLKNDVVDCLTQACFYLNETYKPEKIFIMFDRKITEDVAGECKKEKLNCEVTHLSSEPCSVVRGAALMSAFMTIRQYE